MPLKDVTGDHLRSFLDEVRTQRLDGTSRQLAPTSAARTRAVVRGAFTDARKRRLIDWDPWDAVAAIPLKDADVVDPDMVMSPAQVKQLAGACGQRHPQWESFILLQGFCGLRPGEAIGLRVKDFAYVDGRPVDVLPRTSHSLVPGQFFDEGETRQRPLKGRGPKARRRIPIPRQVTDIVAGHLRSVGRSNSSNRAFTNTAGNAVNLSNFYRDVWRPSRSEVFAPDDPLSGATPHDLRHSAITVWLNAGVPLKTAQVWSGHKTASVLLDTYLGVMQGDEAIALQRFEELIDRTGIPEEDDP